MHGIIYKITNFYNGKSYIGQTIRSLQERINQHFSINKEKISIHDLFGLAKIKYGKTSFYWEILKYCENQEKLDYWEIFYIAYYNTCNRKYGYNISAGGGGVFPNQRKNFSMSKEHKQKIGIANSGINNGMHKSKDAINCWSKKGKESIWYGKTGKDSPNSFEYILTLPNGNHERIIGLNEICRQYNLNKGAMGKIARTNIGHHKGYTIRLVKNFMIGGDLPKKSKIHYNKYKITDKNGKIFIVENGLQNFINENNLIGYSVEEFSRYANSKQGKPYKGYYCEKIY